MSSDDIYVNVFWNETGAISGLSQKINSGQKILISFYNPSAKNSYPIRLRVPNKDLNIVGQNNEKIVGDVVCANLKDSSDC